MKKNRFIKDIFFDSSDHARFYKTADRGEGYYHICDRFISDRYYMEYMPEIYRHDVKNVLYIGSERLHINYCPICGKALD